MIVSLFLAVSDVRAAEIGTYTTSTWYETIQDADGNPVWFQIHYPSVRASYGAAADPSGGPFPLIGFMHGYLGEAWMYQSACDAFASMGFVVVNMDTESGVWMDPYALADDTQTALEWVEARSAQPDHWLHGMAADTPWTVMGHSMGGIAMASLVDQSARVDVAIGFSPYRDGDYAWDAYADYRGDVLLIGGDEDETATPDVVEGWFADVDAPSRGLYTLVQGAGHQAITDIELEAATLSNGEELTTDIGLAAAFLSAERFDDEQAYDTLVCTPPTPLADLAGDATTPATAAVAVDASHLRLSLGGAPGDEAVVYAGTGPGEGTTPDGVVGLAAPVEIARLPLPEGVLCAEVSLPEALAGVAWLQVVHVRADGTALARLIDVYGADSATGDDAAGTTDKGRPDGSSGGCACTAHPLAGLGPVSLLSLAMLLRRRP